MNCQGCGHNYPNTLTRCPRCKMLSNKRNQRTSDSRLIEFPRKAQIPQQPAPSEAAMPQWRQDLNEKVRAIRARRDNPAMAGANPSDRVEEKPVTSSQRESRATTRPLSETATAVVRERSSRIDAFVESGAASQPITKSTNPIVEKALSRVRRASENARREYLPKIEPAQSTRSAYTVENEATARALEPAVEIARSERPAPLPVPEITPAVTEAKAKPAFDSPTAKTKSALDISTIRSASPVKPVPVVERPRTTQPLEPVAVAPQPSIIERDLYVEPVDTSDLNDLDFDTTGHVLTLDEIEPVDYLEAEIRKVDRALTAELHSDEYLTPMTHLLTGVIDLAVIGVSSLPFLALIGLYNGNFGLTSTRTGAAIIVSMIAFFYLALTQSLCSRTFGMMATRTRIIDVFTGESIPASRAIMRTAGYFIGALPAFIGLLWAAFSPQRRGWHDYIAGTRVISEF
jgi:uncharacterized RDD family membrane protein YckC